MTFQLQCPNCGHSLGVGYTNPSADGKATISVSLQGAEVPAEQVQYLAVEQPKPAQDAP